MSQDSTSSLAGAVLALELDIATTTAAEADARTNALFPSSVFALAGRRVSVEGFMQPMRSNYRKPTEFLWRRHPPARCCARMPKLQEWVEVTIKPGSVAARSDQAVQVAGLFHVRPRRSKGASSSIYQLAAELVVDPPGR
jgi:hypothetical protein